MASYVITGWGVCVWGGTRTCSITLGNTTCFVHIVGYLIYQLPLIHISVVYDSAPMYLLQSVIAFTVTQICPMSHYNLL